MVCRRSQVGKSGESEVRRQNRRAQVPGNSGSNRKPKIRRPPELGSLLASQQRSLERAHLREVPDTLKGARMLEEMPVSGDKRAVQFNCQSQEGGVVKREAELAA